MRPYRHHKWELTYFSLEAQKDLNDPTTQEDRRSRRMGTHCYPKITLSSQWDTKNIVTIIRGYVKPSTGGGGEHRSLVSLTIHQKLEGPGARSDW